MRISDWSSDVCSSDLFDVGAAIVGKEFPLTLAHGKARRHVDRLAGLAQHGTTFLAIGPEQHRSLGDPLAPERRSEENTSELQSLMRLTYAVFFLTPQRRKHQTTRLITSLTRQNNLHT